MTILINGWIEVEFAHKSYAAAIIMYFKSDGRYSYDYDHETVTVKIKNQRGKYHLVNKKPIPIDCKTNPTIINVPPYQHKKSFSWFKTNVVRIEFKIGYLAIAGIALRSRDELCKPREYYNENSGKCEIEKDDLTKCSHFKMNHANVSCTELGRQCDVTCNYGYIPKKSFTVYCKKGWWTRSETCKPIDCGILQVENARTSMIYIPLSVFIYQVRHMT